MTKGNTMKRLIAIAIAGMLFCGTAEAQVYGTPNVIQTIGTWTPTDASGASLAFTSASGGYTVIGNMIFAYFTLTFPTTADATQVKIGGLPFSVANQTYAVTPQPAATNAATLSIFGRPIAGTTTFNIFNNVASGSVTNANLTTAVVKGTLSFALN